jgi:concentrative nucleoside transporter, CNT family
MFLINYLQEYNRFMSIIGIFVILFISFVFSNNKKKIKIRTIFSSLFLLFAFAFLTLKLSGGQRVLESISNAIAQLYLLADDGARFIFGNLVDINSSWGFIFGIKVLPIIIFFGALTSVLFYLGVVQKFVQLIGLILRPLLGTSGSETLCAVANSFLGQTEAPLLVRNYLSKMTKSELFVVMVSGMATISGSILAVFAAMGVPAKFMLSASVMSIPASILIAKLFYPEVDSSETASGQLQECKSSSTNIFDAIATGTFDGLSLAVNVAAMLIVFISLIGLINLLLTGFSSFLNNSFSLGLPLLSLNYIFSWLFAPFAYLLGFTGENVKDAAMLLGTKITINELIAYSQMITMNLTERGQAIMTMALCGFANFSCIGIQIGGIGALAPDKRKWLTELGLKTVFAASLANLLSAMVANLVL